MSPESQVVIVVVVSLAILFFLMVKVLELLLDVFCCLVEGTAKTIEQTAPRVGAVCSRVSQMEKEDFDRVVEKIEGAERVSTATLKLISAVRREWPFGFSKKNPHKES